MKRTRRIVISIVIVLAALFTVRQFFPAVADRLPLALGGRDVIAHSVDAYDVSNDGKQVILLSRGTLKRIDITSAQTRHIGKHSVVRTGYDWAEVCWSADKRWIGVATYYVGGRSPLMVVDAATGLSRILSRGHSAGCMAWLPGETQLVWIQHNALSPGRYPQVTSDLFIWNGKGSAKKSRNVDASLRYIASMNALGYIDNIWSVKAFSAGAPLDRIRLIRLDGSELRTISPPPGKFYPPDYQFGCWDVSADGKLIAYTYGGHLWVEGIKPEDSPKDTGPYRALEVHISPAAQRLVIVTTSPESGRNKPIMTGGHIIDPPHQLHAFNTDGTHHHVVCTEREGIRAIKWLNDHEVLYLSGKDLCKRRV